MAEADNRCWGKRPQRKLFWKRPKVFSFWTESRGRFCWGPRTLWIPPNWSLEHREQVQNTKEMAFCFDWKQWFLQSCNWWQRRQEHIPKLHGSVSHADFHRKQAQRQCSCVPFNDKQFLSHTLAHLHPLIDLKYCVGTNVNKYLDRKSLYRNRCEIKFVWDGNW